MVHQPSVAEIIRVADPCLDLGEERPRLRAVNFTVPGLVDEVLLAAGTEPEELEGWKIYCGKPDGTVVKDETTIVLDTVDIASLTGAKRGLDKFQWAASVSLSRQIARSAIRRSQEKRAARPPEAPPTEPTAVDMQMMRQLAFASGVGGSYFTAKSIARWARRLPPIVILTRDEVAEFQANNASLIRELGRTTLPIYEPKG